MECRIQSEDGQHGETGADSGRIVIDEREYSATVAVEKQQVEVKFVQARILI
jgi:hypothetical protein